VPSDFSASARGVSSPEVCELSSRRRCRRALLDLPFPLAAGAIFSAFFTALFEPAFLMYFRSLSNVHGSCDNQRPKERFMEAYKFFYGTKQQKNSLTDHFIVILSACQTLDLYPIRLKCNPL
jgi:hypothetical protein